MEPDSTETGHTDPDFLILRPLTEGECLQIVQEGEEIASLVYRGGCMRYESPYTSCGILQVPFRYTDRLLHIVVDKNGQVHVQFREEGCTLHRLSPSNRPEQMPELANGKSPGVLERLREIYLEIKELLS